MRKQSVQLALAVMALFTLFMSACKKDDYKNPNKLDATFYGLTAGNKLGYYSSKNSSGMPVSQVSLSGLESGEKILAIDFRPATGQLYGVGNNNKLYTINPDNGQVRPVSANAFNPAINGDIIGFDFNPTVDRIRLVTNNGQNLRLNPETGAVAFVDGNLNPGTPMIIGAAYTNNFAGTASTTLYGIDAASGMLFKQDPPNDGKLIEVGSLKVPFSGAGGFDISPDNKIAIASLTAYGKEILYSIDLNSGRASEVVKLKDQLIGIAIPTNAVAYSNDDAGNLLIFNFGNPGSPVMKPFSGLQTGEAVLGLDMRPATGQLYALGSTGRIYTVNMSNGAAVQVGSPFATALSGTSFGFDFNPLVDRIRIVSNTGQNLRVHPETGVVAFVDGALNPGTPMVNAVAYTNNFAGTTATTLYDIDISTDKLFKQDPPNAGTLAEVGNLGANVEGNGGFDIGGRSNKGYALLTVGGTNSIYEVNLTSGAIKKLAGFSANGRSLAVGLGF
jgi:hypothetical protein